MPGEQNGGKGAGGYPCKTGDRALQTAKIGRIREDFTSLKRESVDFADSA